jgi:peptidoglycan/xylan/chitin deacetylase (PgdA/CDA1 family)
MKKTILVLVLFLFFSFFLSAKIIVLGYHKIIANNKNFTCSMPDRMYLEIRANLFKKQVSWLKRKGYKNLTFSQLKKFSETGKDDGKKYVLFTFDDGYKSVIKTAYPILKKYGYTAFIFIIPSVVGKKVWNNEHLSWSDIAFLQSKGWLIGNHTLNHTNLKGKPLSVMKKQVVGAEKILKEHGFPKPVLFAYPQGGFDKAVIEVLKNNKYEFAFTTEKRLVKFNRPYRLGRYFPLCCDRLTKFKKKIRRMK